MSVIETLTEVFALASGAVELADSLIEATKGKGRKADKKDAQIGSSGDYAQIGSSGDSAQIGSSGDSAQIGSSGYSAKIGSSGDYAKIGSSGDYAQIDSSGEKSIISAVGFKSIAKAKVGSWITLAEYKFENERWVVDFVKTEYVDGEKIKGDTFYVLYNHEFRKYVEYDDIPSAEINSKKDIHKVVTFDDFRSGKITYVIEKDGVFSHGETIKEARESFIYKISNRDTSQYNGLKLDDVVSKEEAIKMYRVITGACEFGTKNFVNSLVRVKPSYSIRELIELTDGRYGSEKFKEFFRK